MFPEPAQAFELALLIGLGWGASQLLHDLVASLINVAFQIIAAHKQQTMLKKLRETQQAQSMGSSAPSFLGE